MESKSNDGDGVPLLPTTPGPGEEVPSQRRRAIAVVLIAVLAFLEGVSMSLPGPFFPPEAKNHGLTQSEIGVVAGSLDVANLCFSFVIGSLISPSNKKAVLLTGTIISSAALSLFGLVDYAQDERIYFVLCILTRILNGIGVSMVFTMMILISSTCFPQKVALMNSFIHTVFGVGMFLGPVFGSILIPVGGYVTPFVSIGLIETVFSFLGMIIIPVFPASKKTANDFKTKEYLMFLVSFPALSVFVPTIVVTLMSGFRDSAYALHYHEVTGLAYQKIGLLFVVNALAATITLSVVGVLTQKGFGPSIMIIAQCLTPLTTFAMFLPYILPEIETKGWAILTLATNGVSVDAAINPSYLLLQKAAIKNGVQNIDQVRKYSSSCFMIILSMGRILGAALIGGYLNELVGFYFTSLIYTSVAMVTVTWHIVFLVRSGLIGKVYFDTDVDNDEPASDNLDALN